MYLQGPTPSKGQDVAWMYLCLSCLPNALKDVVYHGAKVGLSSASEPWGMATSCLLLGLQTPAVMFSVTAVSCGPQLLLTDSLLLPPFESHDHSESCRARRCMQKPGLEKGSSAEESRATALLSL